MYFLVSSLGKKVTEQFKEKTLSPTQVKDEKKYQLQQKFSLKKNWVQFRRKFKLNIFFTPYGP